MTSAPASGPSAEAWEELHRRNAALAEAVAARDDFLAAVVHELRNPMTPIVGHVDMLLSAVRAGTYDRQAVQQKLELIKHAMNHYLKRMGTLLEVSRITSGKLRFDPAPLDLVVLLRDLAERFSTAARYARSTITLHAPESLSVTLDSLAVEEIIDNLVSNAIKYGAGRPIELLADDADGHVRVRVRDHGLGIPEADRARIFQRFERGVGLAERRGGFGVGLWVVGQLVDAMGGTVKVEEAPEGGSVFTVTLPRHMGEAL